MRRVAEEAAADARRRRRRHHHLAGVVAAGAGGGLGGGGGGGAGLGGGREVVGFGNVPPGFMQGLHGQQNAARFRVRCRYRLDMDEGRRGGVSLLA